MIIALCKWPSESSARTVSRQAPADPPLLSILRIFHFGLVYLWKNRPIDAKLSTKPHEM